MALLTVTSASDSAGMLLREAKGVLAVLLCLFYQRSMNRCHGYNYTLVLDFESLLDLLTGVGVWNIFSC
jgi:hypothetical protein